MGHPSTMGRPSTMEEVPILPSGGGNDATFVTRNIPDISATAGLIGLCTVPLDRAGPGDLGWHIADFLAFKAILGGYLHEMAQTWLSHCDIAKLVSENPEAYTHGTDRRIFGPGKLTDNIRVESSADDLTEKFLKAITRTATIIKKYQYDLVIFICGPTTLEQDAFFGTNDYSPRIRSTNIRIAIGSNDCRAMVITPALFSAGWQVNPSFCRQVPFPTRADRAHFLAKQFGAIFARPVVAKVLGWNCPMLDLTMVDPLVRAREGFPGPVRSYLTKAALAATLHKALAARLMLEHSNHSFSFDKGNDDWEKVSGPRKHRTLMKHQREWEKLEVVKTTVDVDPDCLFEGNVFGGAKASQLAQIKHLVRDSLTVWQGVWVNEFGREAKAKFQEFLDNANPTERACHEMFHVMEQRSTLLVMADLLVGYLELPLPLGERCRDYTATTVQPGTTAEAFGYMCRSIPWVYLPVDIGTNQYGKIQDPHHRDAQYVAAALGLTYKDSDSLDVATGCISRRKCIYYLLIESIELIASLSLRSCPRSSAENSVR